MAEKEVILSVSPSVRELVTLSIVIGISLPVLLLIICLLTILIGIVVGHLGEFIFGSGSHVTAFTDHFTKHYLLLLFSYSLLAISFSHFLSFHRYFSNFQLLSYCPRIGIHL